MITIRIKAEENTHTEEWSFSLLDYTLVLDRYAFIERTPGIKRRGTPTKIYDRSYGRLNTIQEVDVPLPEHIKKQAMDKLMESITIKKWNEITKR